MKKYVAMILCVALLTTAVFFVPAQALVPERQEVYEKIDFTHWDLLADYYGSISYWEEYVSRSDIDFSQRPEPLLGDANIDGKVNAIDALFALNFAVYGNQQTYYVVSGSKTNRQIQWGSTFDTVLYHEGTLEGMIGTKANYLNYCQYNSCFFADVSKDYIINAVDALEILKYAVGNDADFSTKDLSGWSLFCYYPWPTEYYPGYSFENGPVTPTPTDVA